MDATFSIIGLIKLGGSVAGGITAMFALLCAFIKPIRKWLVVKIKSVAKSEEFEQLLKDTNESLQLVRETQQAQKEAIETLHSQLDLLTESDLCQTRNTITHLYQKYLPGKEIPMYERENVIHLYESYISLGGNSYIKQIYTEMMTWGVKTD